MAGSENASHRPSPMIWRVPKAMTMKPQKMTKWTMPTGSLKSFFWPRT